MSVEFCLANRNIGQYCQFFRLLVFRFWTVYQLARVSAASLSIGGRSGSESFDLKVKEVSVQAWKTGAYFVLAVIAVGILPGCSGAASDHPPLLPVTGTVTLDHAPVAGARVQFLPTEGRSSAGITDDQGKFTLIYDVNLTGAIAGQHQVSISLYETIPGKTDDEGQPMSEEKLPAEYNTNTKLTATVDSEHLDFNFDLKSAKPSRP